MSCKPGSRRGSRHGSIKTLAGPQLAWAGEAQAEKRASGGRCTKPPAAGGSARTPGTATPQKPCTALCTAPCTPSGAHLGIPQQHGRVGLVEDRVVGAGVAGAHRPLHHDHLLGLPHLNHRHAGNHGVGVLHAGRRDGSASRRPSTAHNSASCRASGVREATKILLLGGWATTWALPAKAPRQLGCSMSLGAAPRLPPFPSVPRPPPAPQWLRSSRCRWRR